MPVDDLTRVAIVENEPAAELAVSLLETEGIWAMWRKTDIPSARLKVGDEVGFTTRGAKTEYAQVVQETIKSKQAPTWLSLDMAALKGRVLSEPTLEHAEAFFDPNVIVEYYSR